MKKEYLGTMIFEYKQKTNGNYSFIIAKDYKDDFLEILQKGVGNNIKIEFREIIK